MTAADIGDLRSTLELRHHTIQRRKPVLNDIRAVARAEEAGGRAKKQGAWSPQPTPAPVLNASWTLDWLSSITCAMSKAGVR